MNTKLQQSLRIGLFLVLGGLLVVLPFYWFSASEKNAFFNALSRADYTWVGVSIGIGVIAHLSRAIRWRMLLEPLGHSPSLFNIFASVMVGYLANYAVPRLGEVSRCGVLTRYENIPFVQSFGTVIVERLIDFLTMLLICVITLIIQFDKLANAADAFLLSKIRGFMAGIAQSPTKLVLAGCLFLIFIIGIILIRNRMKGRLGEKIKALIKGFTDGLQAIRKLRRPWLFLAHSLFIWVLYWMAMYVCFFALPETAQFTPNDALILLIFGTIGVVFTPGGLGAYQGLLAGVLFTLYKFPTELGAAFGWIAWCPQLIGTLIFGLVVLIALPIRNRKKNENSV